MNTDIENLRALFRESYEIYEDSYNESIRAWEYFHNRQWNESQLNTLKNRGQPAETFNVVKMLSRLLLGYYSTVITSINVVPKHYKNATKAALFTSVIKYILQQNNFNSNGDRIKLSALLSGLMVGYVNTFNTGEKDSFGRPLRNIKIDYVPVSQIVLDPLSTEPDYSDARYIHRFKWVFKDEAERVFGKAKVAKLSENCNSTGVETADLDLDFDGRFSGYYAIGDLYLIVHTCIVNNKGEVESVYWSGDVELERKPFKLDGVKFPYVITKVNYSEKKEFYGIFREVMESQDAINQAIIKIQLMANTQKIFVETNSLDGTVEEFVELVNRINSVIPVKSLQGIRVEQLSKDIVDQYRIIDNALDRIKMMLSINDSFLGLAFAADSGRKVNIQKNSSIMALRYLTTKIEEFYSSLGETLIQYVKNYFTAEQALRVSDDLVGERWVRLNQPMKIPEGVDPESGEIKYRIPFEEVLDPQTKEPMIIDNKIVMAPVPEEDTELAFDDFEVEVKSTSFTDEDEKNQLMLETVLSGNVGSMLAKINPGGYFKVVGLSLREMKTKYSPVIADILEETSAMLQQNIAAEEEAKQAAQGRPKDQRKSQELKVPEQ